MKSSAGTIMLDAAASWHGNDMRLQYDVSDKYSKRIIYEGSFKMQDIFN